MTDGPQHPGDGHAPGDKINGFTQLYPRQQTMDHKWAVLSLRNDQPTLHHVDLTEPDCTCGDMEYNASGAHECCDHIAAAAFSASKNFSEADVRAAFTRLLSDASKAVSELRNLRDVARAAQNANAAAAVDEAAETSGNEDKDDSAPNENGEIVNDDVEPDGAQQEIAKSLSEWFDQAADVSGFDASIIDVSYATAAGDAGFVVDRVPWQGENPYYDDDEWQDKEGFEEEKESVKDAVLNRDEFEWFGDPDYQWWISEENAMELVS